MEMHYTYEELYKALEQSLSLQQYYAKLLNMYDGGRRYESQTVTNWIDRLRLIKQEERKNK